MTITKEINSPCCKWWTSNKCNYHIRPEKLHTQLDLSEPHHVPDSNTSSTSDQTSSAARSEGNRTDDERKARFHFGKHVQKKSAISGGGVIESWSSAPDNRNKLKTLEQSMDTKAKLQHRTDAKDKYHGHPKYQAGHNPPVQHFSKELLEQVTQQQSKCTISPNRTPYMNCLPVTTVKSIIGKSRKNDSDSLPAVLDSFVHQRMSSIETQHLRRNDEIKETRVTTKRKSMYKLKKLSELLPECRVSNIHASGGRCDFSKWFRFLPPNIQVDKDLQTDRGVFKKDNFQNDQALKRYLNIH